MRLPKHVLRALLALSLLLAGTANASVDPVAPDPNTGANSNRYAYANNNPYRYVDPDGRQSRDFEAIYKASGAQPPAGGNGPNLFSWGVAEVLCGFCDLNYTAPAGSGALQPIVTPMETSLGGGAARAVSALAHPRAVPAIATQHGMALQGPSAEALAALNQVQNGSPLYRAGTFGRQNAMEGQFWSLQNPSTTVGYADQMGMPGPAGQSFDWVIRGQLLPGQPVITRPAPGLGVNSGGAMEAVVNPGAVRVEWFTMP